ncbi:NAD(P)-dependent oxidoreductase [Marinobacter sp. GN3S48]|uniref:NAD(P)-dependent oxidoreductase n=1 Tax=Marinobacter sp. GN3S48 TaxID=3382302 RepID=UPI00387A869B
MDLKRSMVGFIGLGKMGWPIARNLSSNGVHLTVNDADIDVAKKFADTYSVRYASYESLGEELDVVILMLPNGDIVNSVLFGGEEGGASGLAHRLEKGSLVIDMSSSEPNGTWERGQALAELGIAFMDAPVSGGVKKADSAELAIMVGGDELIYEDISPLLAMIGKKLFHVGPLGAGHAIKALNNYVSAAGLVAASDAVQIARHFGIEPAKVVDVLNASSGRNNSTEVKFQQFILSQAFNSGFSLDLMAKDLGIALSMAEGMHRSSPVLETCAELWNQAKHSMPEGCDHTEIFRFLSEDG